MTSELRATVEAGLPPTPTPGTSGRVPWGEVGVLPLAAGDGSPPLWAAFSQGMGFYDREAGHFVALYTYDEGDWQELDRVVLTSCAEYVGPESLDQVELEPSRIWLEMQSGVGAHGGCYDLLSFDGETLRVEATNSGSSPDAGGVADLDGDGIQEVILDQTEDYVFCYACGVRLPRYRLLRWDGEQLVEVELAALPASAPAELQALNDEAVELAQAGLWKDALETITREQEVDGQEPDSVPTMGWNEALIRLHAEAMAQQADDGFYPLLSNVFYGDYAAAVELMRPFGVEEIWGPQTPLVAGTVAEGFELELSDWISRATNLALRVRPDLAGAYFLRGWGAHLRDSGDPQVVADVERASVLAPGDRLFSASAGYLQAPLSPEPTAEPTSAPAVATAIPTPAATPIAEEYWEVRTLLVGPGEPGRLYALLADQYLAAWPAERARLVISDDYGQTWLPFPGGLPDSECIRNVNLDYSAPSNEGRSDALYASTCQGLYRFSAGAGLDEEWVQVSPEETGMVAVVYGQPEVMWATTPFASGGSVIRSDDGGRTWMPAGSGLVHFNGVANLGIDPRDANTLYAIIWPKYAGTYLRRGTGGGQWQYMPTPLDNTTIGTGMTIDGATGALYVIAWDWQQEHDQLWRTPNPTAPDLHDVRWELVHDFGGDVRVELLGSGWSPEGLALYANIWPVTRLGESAIEMGQGVVHRSQDGGLTWTPLPIP